MFLEGMAWKDGALKVVAALAVVAVAGAAAPQAGADVIGSWNLNGPEIGAGPVAAATVHRARSWCSTAERP